MPEPISGTIVSLLLPDGSIEWWQLTDGWHLIKTEPAIESMASDAELAAHVALPDAHHPANVGITGSKVVGGFRLTFTNGLLTGFEAV